MLENAIVFGNNKYISGNISERINQSGTIAELKLSASRCSESEIQKIASSVNGKTLVLVFRNEELKNITEQFHRLDVENLYICPWDTHYSDEKPLSDLIIPVDNSKPRLNYLEVEISNNCNLNCKGCSEFSTLVCENNQVDFHLFTLDLKRLKGFFWGIEKIRLLGGEPLTNPNFLSFIKAAREIWPDSDLRLVTNGLLIPALNKTELSEIKRNNCTFDISNYPPTRKIIKTIKKKLGQSGVGYSVSVPINFFFKLFLPEPLESPDESYNNCLFTHCHSLGGGYLSACSHQFWAHRLNTAFDLCYPVDEKIDIYKTSLTGWEINEIFKKPLDFCRYCPKGMVPFKWEPCKPGEAKPEDWIAKISFLNLKVLPVIQKAFKYFSLRLRHSVQHPKSGRY
jgi:hypothetical protein